MIYIDCDKNIVELIKLWFIPNYGEIETGNNIDTAIQRLRAEVCTILINPWEHIKKDAKGIMSPETKELIGWIKQRIEEKTCIVFGGTGETQILGKDSVRTESFSKTNGKSVIEMMLAKNPETID